MEIEVGQYLDDAMPIGNQVFQSYIIDLNTYGMKYPRQFTGCLGVCPICASAVDQCVWVYMDIYHSSGYAFRCNSCWTIYIKKLVGYLDDNGEFYDDHDQWIMSNMRRTKNYELG